MTSAHNEFTMELIRYKPGEAIRWLETGAQDKLKNAKRKGKSVVRREGERTIGRDLKEVAGAMMELGKSAMADLIHKQAEATEYVLFEDHFEARTGSRVKSIAYQDVEHIYYRQNDKVTLELDQGGISIQPVAHLVAGRVKVPVGWQRNGLEVPYELLIDELSARCDVEVERS